MPLLIFLGLIFHALWIRIWGPSSEPPSPLAELTEALEKALILIVEGEHQRAATILDSVGTPASRIRGEDGRILRARHGLLVGELLGLMDRRGEALASYGRVRAELEKLPHGDPRNFDLEICADLGRGLLVTAAGATTEDVAAGERAIGREAEVKRPDTLMKMTRLAHWLGMVHQNGGRWEQARVHYEHAVKISERVHPPGGVGLDFSWSPAARLLFWAEARSMASAAAIELGLTLLSLGESDSGRAWLERAVSILEGPETASVQVQRAKALLVLAQQGFRDGIEDEVTRESLLERAVGAGLKSNATTGRIFACQAEIGRGLLDGDRGMSEAAAVHYRRAAGYLEGISDSNADEFAAQALLTLGLELAGAGAVGEAMDAFRQALARGRESTDYDARRHAAVAAYYLHRMLLSQDHPGDGGPVLDVLNALVPTLAANVRPLFVAFASRSRGWQHVIEKRPVRHVGSSRQRNPGAAWSARRRDGIWQGKWLRIWEPSRSEPDSSGRPSSTSSAPRRSRWDKRPRATSRPTSPRSRCGSGEP